jgi:hypothetical protein
MKMITLKEYENAKRLISLYENQIMHVDIKDDIPLCKLLSTRARNVLCHVSDVYNYPLEQLSHLVNFYNKMGGSQCFLDFRNCGSATRWELDELVRPFIENLEFKLRG